MADESTSTQILRSAAVAIVRHLLSIVAAYLISKGLVAPEILSEGNLLILAGGAVTALISLGWILYNKFKTHNLVEAAREAPAGTDMADIRDNAAAKPLFGTGDGT